MDITKTFPPFDFDLSPYTGWTRAHWERLLARLTCGYIQAADRSGSPARALFPDDRRNLPDSVDGLESFARMASAWGAWLGNPQNPAVISFAGLEMDLEYALRQALLDGTDPDKPATYWGDITHMSQHIVEAADMAVAVWLSRERVFYRMEEQERDQVMAWLAQVDGKGTYPDNWVLFTAMAQTVRLKLGYPVPVAELDFRLDQAMAFYSGDGWYVDGEGDEYELYNAWMFGWHFLLWAWIDGDRRPEDRQAVLNRSRAFIDGFQHFFGANGSYPAWGRSIVYRFAAVAVFATGHLLGTAPADPGMLRRISSGCIRYFYDREIFDPIDQHLRQGYHGDFPAANEPYISPGSVYWACHGLFGLFFDRSDPFWTAKETPMPVERADFDLAFPAPGFAVSGRRSTGQVLLLNSRSGIGHDLPGYNYTTKYGKLLYSTHFPFNLLPARGAYTPDAMISLVTPDGQFGHRLDTRMGEPAPGMIWCEFNEVIHGEPQKIRVAVFLWDDVQIRLAHFLPTVPVRAVEGPGMLGGAGAAGVARRSNPEAGWEYAGRDACAVSICRLWGYDSQQASAPFLGYSNLNLAHPYAELPLVCETVSSADARSVAAASLVRPAVFDPDQVFQGISTEADGAGDFDLLLPGGERLFASLGFEPRLKVQRDAWSFCGPGLRILRWHPERGDVSGTGISAVEPFFTCDRPGTVEIQHSLDTILITTSTGLAFNSGYLAGPLRRVDVETLSGTWVDVSAAVSADVLPAALVDEWSLRNQRSLVRFRVRL